MKKNILFIALIVLLTSCGEEKNEAPVLEEKATEVVESILTEWLGETVASEESTDIEEDPVNVDDEVTTEEDIESSTVEINENEGTQEIESQEVKAESVVEVMTKEVEEVEVTTQEKVEVENTVSEKEPEHEETSEISKEEADKLADDMVNDIDAIFKDL